MIIKNLNSTITLLSVSFILVLSAFIILPAKSAGSASFSVKSSGTHQVGKTFSVNVYENSGNEQVDSVQADLNFDASKLECLSISGSGSPFDFGIEDGCTPGSGNLSIGKTILSGASVSGEQFVAKITFKMKASSGAHPVSFSTSSAIVTKSDNPQNIWNGVTAGAQFTATAVPESTKAPSTSQPNETPSSPSEPEQPQAPSNNDKQNTSNEVKPNDDAPVTPTSKPKIEEGRLDKVTFTGAKFSLVADKLTTAKLVVKNLQNNEVQTSLSSDLDFQHTLNIDDLNLLPGVSYEYFFEVTDKSGNTAKSDVETFVTLGYELLATITDSEGRPVSNTKVELRSEPRYEHTNQDGEVRFTNVAPGVHTLSLNVGEGVYSQQIVVDDTLGILTSVYDGTTAQEQVLALQLPYEVSSGLSLPKLAGLIAALMLLAVVLILFFRKDAFKDTQSKIKKVLKKERNHKNYSKHTLEQIEKDVHAKHNSHGKHVAPPAIIHPQKDQSDSSGNNK